MVESFCLTRSKLKHSRCRWVIFTIRAALIRRNEVYTSMMNCVEVKSFSSCGLITYSSASSKYFRSCNSCGVRANNSEKKISTMRSAYLQCTRLGEAHV